jgi:hypothetical protein
MGDHCKNGWPSLQKAFCFRVHLAQEQGKHHTGKQLHSLIDAIAVELNVKDYTSKSSWFYRVLRRHKIQDKPSGDKRLHKPSSRTEERPNLLGLAASTGPLKAKTTKSLEVAEACFSKVPKCVAEP